MDSEVLDAATIVDIDPAQATEWFELINRAYLASPDDWDAFQETLTSAAGGNYGATAETFLGYASDHGRTDLVGKLVAELQELPSAYASSRSQSRPAAVQSPGSLWDTVVQQFGSSWAGWDGSETGWAQFRDWTYSAANSQNPALYTAAYDKLNPLNSVPLAERIGKLADFGFTVRVTARAAGTDTHAAASQSTPTTAQPAQPAEQASSMDEIVEESLAEALKEIPGSEALTPEELAKLRVEIAEELARDTDE